MVLKARWILIKPQPLDRTANLAS